MVDQMHDGRSTDQEIGEEKKKFRPIFRIPLSIGITSPYFRFSASTSVALERISCVLPTAAQLRFEAEGEKVVANG